MNTQQAQTPQDVTVTLFQDSMDSSRFLRIKTEKQHTVIAKVYFGKSKNHLAYHGLTELPKSLFYFDGGSRIGFNPAREEEDPKLKMLREAAYRGRGRRDDNYDRDDRY